MRNSKGEVFEYRIRPVNHTDAGKREAIMRTPGTEHFPKPTAGATLPNFLIYDMQGKPITPQKLLGKVTVISFWFSTCKPCLYEMPYINQMAASFAGNPNVLFIAPDPEPKYSVEKFMEIQPFAYIACPEATSIIDAMKIHIFPSHVIVGRDGRILKSYAGGVPGIEDVLKRDVDAVLKGELVNEGQ
jgi:thiol-disulfide isomerase/thioredoxin